MTDRSLKELMAVTFTMILFGCIFTYPLIKYFNSRIPFTYYSETTKQEKSGDHLQTYYWFWLLKDNLVGSSKLFSNPYEFNMGSEKIPQGYHMFPFSVLFLILSPFGDIFAYNGTIILSFVLAGIFTYLLVKLFTGNIAASIISAIIFTVSPFRVSQVASGHLNGFVFFFFPLVVYLFELAVTRKRMLYSILCGIFIFFLSLMEKHLIYFLVIFLAAYIPMRLLVISQLSNSPTEIDHNISSQNDKIGIIQFFIQYCIGIVFVVFYQMIISNHYKISLINKELLFALIIIPIIYMMIEFMISHIYRFLFNGISLKECFTVESISNLPFLLLLMYGLQFKLEINHFEKYLLGITLLISIYLKFMQFKILSKRGKIKNNISMDKTRKFCIIIIPAFLFIVISSMYLLKEKDIIYSQSIVQGGRTIRDVEIFSPKIKNMISIKASDYVSEKCLYLGILPGLMLLLCMYKVFRLMLIKNDNNNRVRDYYILFFTISTIISYYAALGLSFGHWSIYKILFNYIPFFRYQRVPSRLLIVSFFSLSILIGLFISDIQQAINKKLSRKFGNLIFLGIALLILIDYHSFKPIGLTELRKSTVYGSIKNNISNGLLLEIPLWPGDSHYSSLYEYYITKDQIKRVNGYSPIVSRKYIEKIFKPLENLNLGVMGDREYHILKDIHVDYLTVHNNIDVFRPKVASNYFSDQKSFPPLWVSHKEYDPYWTARRLMNSKYVTFVEKDKYKGIYLFKLVQDIENNKNSSGIYQYPMSIDAINLGRKTGSIVYDQLRSKDVILGNLNKDNADVLTYGPYWILREGGFKAVFRIKNDNIQINQPVVQIQVSSPKFINNRFVSEEILKKRDIKGNEFISDKVYQDFEIDFSIQSKSTTEFRTIYYKQSNIWIDKIILTTPEAVAKKYFFEAERSLGTTGDLVYDDSASGNRMIYAGTDTHQSGYLFVTPERTYLKGRYRGFIRMRIDELDKNQIIDKPKNIATLDIAINDYKDIIFLKQIGIEDVADTVLKDIPIDFTLSKDNELSFRFWFNDQINTWVDCITIEKTNPL